MADDTDHEMTDDEEEAWCAAQRAEIAGYLSRNGLAHGEIGDWPAWHVPPHVSLWAIESLARPGWVGWWAISGDLPTDYCSADDCRHPRLAVERIALSWQAALDQTKAGAATIGATGLPASLGPLMKARAEVLLDWVTDADMWPGP